MLERNKQTRERIWQDENTPNRRRSRKNTKRNETEPIFVPFTVSLILDRI